jgi:hypothetical protein
MRVNPPLVYSGSFWLPGTPDRKLPGTLTIEDGGSPTLEVVGRLDDGHPFNAPRDYPRILGEVIQHGFVTLEKSFLTSSGHHGSGAPYKNKMQPSLAVIGCAFDKDEVVLFDELRFSFEGLDEFLGISGFELNWLTSADSVLKLEYTPQKSRELWRNDDFSLHCEFDFSAPTTSLKSAEVIQSAFLRLRSTKPVPLSHLTKWVHELGHLVAFAVDANIALHSVTAYSTTIRREEGTKWEKMVPLPLYYASLTSAPKVPDLREIDRLFKLADLPVSSQSAFDAWFRFHAANAVAANLYFTTRKTKFEYLNIQFVLMAQAAEVYHRNTSPEKLMSTGDFERLKKQMLEAIPEPHRKMVDEKLAHGHHLNLSHRLERLMAPYEEFFGDATTRNATIKSIVGTRNHYIHWGNPANRDRFGGLNLWTNLMRLDMLMQMQLLKELGFSIEAVIRTLESNPAFQRQRHLLKPTVLAAGTPSSPPPSEVEED